MNLINFLRNVLELGRPSKLLIDGEFRYLKKSIFTIWLAVPRNATPSRHFICCGEIFAAFLPVELIVCRVHRAVVGEQKSIIVGAIVFIQTIEAVSSRLVEILDVVGRVLHLTDPNAVVECRNIE